MKFCRECGTFYSEKQGECPKCATRDLVIESARMGEEELRRERRKHWLELIVGIPLFIGVIYLIIFVMRSLGGS